MTPSADKKNRSLAGPIPYSKAVTYSALLTALSLIFSYIEGLFPIAVGIPGIKLGIANLVIIVALYILGPVYGLAINLVRVFISGLLFSGVFGIIYSLAGALLSYFTMLILKKTGVFSPVGVSVAGGVMHNFGQIIVASFIMGNINIFSYFPVLIFSGVGSGFIIGILASIIIRRFSSIDL